jgi:hypothetical protein
VLNPVLTSSPRYRYDGLYQVLSVSAEHKIHGEQTTHLTIQAWTERGLNPGGYLVCKYAFRVRRGALAGLTFRLTHLYQRLPNQPLIPTRVLDDSDSNASDGGKEGEDENSNDDGATEDEE